MTVTVAIGTEDEPGMLDFLIGELWQKLIMLLHLGLDLDDVTELDLNGGAEAVAAVLGQPEFLL